MVVALNLSGAAVRTTTVGLSPLTELMTCLHALVEPDHHPELRDWTARIGAGLSDTLRADLYRFAPLWARYRMRLFYPTSHRLDRPLDAELDELADMPDDLFLPLMANAIRGRDLRLRDAAQTRGEHDWVRECEHRSFTRGDLAYSLHSNPDRVRTELVSILAACNKEFFADEWARSLPRLQATADTVRQRIATETLTEVVESLSKMASCRGSDTTVFFDKLQTASGAVGREGLLLIPSIRAWPHVMIKMDARLPVVLHFLAQEALTEGRAQSQEEIRIRLLVLAEPGRWELCRHLINESITTTELATRTGLPKPAVSRHLRILREAGLISSQKESRQVFHRLNPSMIVHLGHDVLRAIIR